MRAKCFSSEEKDHPAPLPVRKSLEEGDSGDSPNLSRFKPAPCHSVTVQKVYELKSFITDQPCQWSFTVVDGPNTTQPLLGGSTQKSELEESSRSSIQCLEPKDEVQCCGNPGCLNTSGFAWVKDLSNKLLCPQCTLNFKKGYVCRSCQYVYGDTATTPDTKEWLGCSSCKRQARMKGRKRNAGEAGLPIYQQPGKKLPQLQEKCSLFEMKGAPLFSSIESVLNISSCKLSLGQKERKQDMQKIKRLLEVNYLVEDKEKRNSKRRRR